jgi:hypothetical protein
MILRSGEVSVGSERIPWAVGPDGVQRVTGTLYLTSHRLVFEAMVVEGGVGAVPKTLLDLNLAWVTNAGAFQPTRRDTILRVETGPQYAYTFATPYAAQWASAILGWRAKVVAQLPAAGSTPAPVVVQVQHTPTQPLVLLHCRHCGTLNDAGSRTCKSCGATL